MLEDDAEAPRLPKDIQDREWNSVVKGCAKCHAFICRCAVQRYAEPGSTAG